MMAAAAFGLERRAAATTTRTVSFRTTDGVQIAATFYEPSARPAPAVILVHMLTRAGSDWHPFATRLADAGISALAIDLRGHGASGAGSRPAAADEDLSRMVLDLQAARAFLDARPEVRPDAVGIAGASIGANLAALAAASDPGIRSLALISPGLDYRGLRIDAAMRKYGERPALLLASVADPYASRSVRQLANPGPNAPVSGIREIRLVETFGHGTVLLARDGDLARALVDWFQRTLL